mmetsp:Transcript_60433/g.129601  ORF Transcript_60433/g.129601 Transcript_60433/m.129601 type:complete len:241 (-) Transcript_60433:458-1180(-)
MPHGPWPPPPMPHGTRASSRRKALSVQASLLKAAGPVLPAFRAAACHRLPSSPLGHTHRLEKEAALILSSLAASSAMAGAAPSPCMPELPPLPASLPGLPPLPMPRAACVEGGRLPLPWGQVSEEAVRHHPVRDQCRSGLSHRGSAGAPAAMGLASVGERKRSVGVLVAAAAAAPSSPGDRRSCRMRPAHPRPAPSVPTPPGRVLRPWPSSACRPCAAKVGETAETAAPVVLPRRPKPRR